MAGHEGSLDLFAAIERQRQTQEQTAELPRPLSDRVRVISLWEPYASLVVDGVKTIETREWSWPYDPSWLVIHAAKKVDREACARLALPRIGYKGGSLIGLVWVSGDRPLLPEDERAACFYASSRRAWLLKDARRFAAPVTFRGPQKFASIERAVVLRALVDG